MTSSSALKALFDFLSGIGRVLILYATKSDPVAPIRNFELSVYMNMSLTLCSNLGSTIYVGWLR